MSSKNSFMSTLKKPLHTSFHSGPIPSNGILNWEPLRVRLTYIIPRDVAHLCPAYRPLVLAGGRQRRLLRGRGPTLSPHKTVNTSHKALEKSGSPTLQVERILFNRASRQR